MNELQEVCNRTTLDCSCPRLASWKDFNARRLRTGVPLFINLLLSIAFCLETSLLALAMSQRTKKGYRVRTRSPSLSPFIIRRLRKIPPLIVFNMFSRFSLSFILIAARLFPAHAQIQWDDVYNSCGPPADTANGGAAIISDVVNMGKVSGAFMDKLEAGQLNQPPWDNYRVAAMFDVVFDAKQPDAEVRWSTVRTNLQTMANIATTKKKIWVSCDDTTLFGVDLVGSTSRQFFTDPYSKVKIYTDTQTDTPFRQCADGVVVNGVTRYQLGYRATIKDYEQDYDLVIICSGQNERRPLTLDRVTYGVGSDLYSLMTVSTIFFHEMCHVVLGGSKSEDDPRAGPC